MISAVFFVNILGGMDLEVGNILTLFAIWTLRNLMYALLFNRLPVMAAMATSSRSRAFFLGNLGI